MDHNFEISYNSRNRVEQHTSVILNANGQKIGIVRSEGLYYWHKNIDKYLILAILSQGGSGHTISMCVYNLDDIVSEIK